MAGRPLATLGGIPLHTNPDEIRWNFKMRTIDHKTMGGKVIQVLGTTMGDITVKGSFGTGDRTKGDTEGWQNQLRFRKQIEAMADDAVNAKNAKPIIFTYSPRNWRFEVFVKSLSPVHLATDEFNPKWQVVLFPLEDQARTVIQGVKDLYIQRLMNGVGWKQTEYNGPTQEEVDATLGGGSVEDYLAQSMEDAYHQGAGGGNGQGGIQ